MTSLTVFFFSVYKTSVHVLCLPKSVVKLKMTKALFSAINEYHLQNAIKKWQCIFGQILVQLILTQIQILCHSAILRFLSSTSIFPFLSIMYTTPQKHRALGEGLFLRYAFFLFHECKISIRLYKDIKLVVFFIWKQNNA